MLVPTATEPEPVTSVLAPKTTALLAPVLDVPTVIPEPIPVELCPNRVARLPMIVELVPSTAASNPTATVPSPIASDLAITTAPVYKIPPLAGIAGTGSKPNPSSTLLRVPPLSNSACICSSVNSATVLKELSIIVIDSNDSNVVIVPKKATEAGKSTPLLPLPGSALIGFVRSPRVLLLPLPTTTAPSEDAGICAKFPTDRVLGESLIVLLPTVNESAGATKLGSLLTLHPISLLIPTEKDLSAPASSCDEEPITVDSSASRVIKDPKA